MVSAAGMRCDAGGATAGGRRPNKPIFIIIISRVAVVEVVEVKARFLAQQPLAAHRWLLAGLSLLSPGFIHSFHRYHYHNHLSLWSVDCEAQPISR